MSAAPLTKEAIIDDHELSFDPGDPQNGSLYLCEARNGGSGLDRAAVLAKLRAAGLWSAEPEKQVPDAHRQAYKDQMQFVEATVYRTASGAFLIARFDHPKYPSSAARWQAWQAFFDREFTRA